MCGIDTKSDLASIGTVAKLSSLSVSSDEGEEIYCPTCPTIHTSCTEKVLEKRVGTKWVDRLDELGTPHILVRPGSRNYSTT